MSVREKSSPKKAAGRAGADKSAAAKTDGRLVLEDFVPYRLSVLTNRVSHAIAREYGARFGLSIAEWRVMAVLDKRLGRFGLTLHPDKTRLVPFVRPPKAQQSGKGPATFDFVGFTF